MNIHESGEDYLETILMLCKQSGSARSVDIAAHLGVTKPSVSFAMKKLRENGYILMGDDNRITLTEEGEVIACRAVDFERFAGIQRTAEIALPVYLMHNGFLLGQEHLLNFIIHFFIAAKCCGNTHFKALLSIFFLFVPYRT